MNWIKNGWAWIKAHASYLETFEPSTLRGIYMALIGLLATLGISVSQVVDTKVNAFIGLLVVILPVLQSLWTRAKVVPVTVSTAAVQDALYTPAPPAPDVTHMDVIRPDILVPVPPVPEVPAGDTQDSGNAPGVDPTAPLAASQDVLDAPAAPDVVEGAAPVVEPPVQP
jgi:hypothetical protein